MGSNSVRRFLLGVSLGITAIFVRVPLGFSTTPINLGGGVGFDFTINDGTGFLRVDISASIVGASFISDSGTASFGATNFEIGPYNAGTDSFPAAGTESLSITMTNDADTLAGTIHWTQVTNGSSQAPILNGTLSIGSSSGDSAFTTAFPAGSTPLAVYAVANLSVGVPLSAFTSPPYFPNFSEFGSGSSGQITPVPEPTSFGLVTLALGVLGLGGWARKRH